MLKRTYLALVVGCTVGMLLGVSGAWAADNAASQIPTSGEKIPGAPGEVKMPWGTFKLAPRIADKIAKHEKINYVEFPAKDIERTKAFFAAAFGWSFVDYGPDYAAFSDQGLDGGFYRSGLQATTDRGSALIVLYSDRLEETQAKVEHAGGKIARRIFSPD